MKTLLKYLLILGIATLIAIVMISLACCIPRNLIYNNSKESAIQINRLGEKRMKVLLIKTI